MKIVITLPKEIRFSDSAPLLCEGLAGTDSPTINCKVDKAKKTITITDAVTYQRGNPGTIKFNFFQLVNPIENVVTSSFKIATFTSQDYALDIITANITVNFYCEYPCQSCNQNEKSTCNTCYLISDFNIWFNSQCINVCPNAWVNTSSNNCTKCEEPCATCISSPTNCTTCIDGYWKTEKGSICYLKVKYPFPYFWLSVLFFILIAISECVTKTESRFKESFIALISIPEILCWINYIVFLFVKIDYKKYSVSNVLLDKELAVPAFLAVLALFTYFLINFSHALIHPRKMIPNVAESYKVVMEHYKWTTRFHWTISYVVSFKYSLILVSYMWNQP